MVNSPFILIIFWGVWLLIPILFDGILTFVYMHTIIFHDLFKKKSKTNDLAIEPHLLPMVSIIIPAYNEEENIDECLNYLEKQTYPPEKMEIIVVDNGSTDRTARIVEEHIEKIRRGSLVEGKTEAKKLLRLLIQPEKGKANALNTGIRLSCGEIIINIDSRSFLDSEAIFQMVAKFVNHPEYGAATGNVEIDWRMLHRRNAKGEYIYHNGKPVRRFLTRKETFLAKAQFLEYMTSFRLGREFQDITGSMYTFSGAFAAYRRNILFKTNLYSSRTLAEDTDLTLDLHGLHVRLGFAQKAKAYLKPVISLEKFYAQRVRWHRGQIEVIGLHLDWYANLRKGFWRNLLLGLLFLMDHTFGFPRIIWTFLLPLFFLFGYSMALIIKAILLMYAFYIFMDLLNTLNCYRVSDAATRKKIAQAYQYCLVTPIFRIMAFYFRFAGYLDALKEEPTWKTPYSPVHSTKTRLGRLYVGYNNFSQKPVARLLQLPPAPKLEYDEKIAEGDTYGLEKKEKEYEE